MKRVTIPELRDKLKNIGAKTSGTKAVLQERLKTWEENNLNSTLVSVNLLPAKREVLFPSDSSFVPLGEMKKSALKRLDEEVISEWFDSRHAKASKSKGRILALKKFVKCVEVCHSDSLLFVKALCAAQTRKHIDYACMLLIDTKTSNGQFTVCQAKCSCPAGKGWSASCKHLGALIYLLEHFNITGDSLEFVSKTSLLQSWHRPTPGRNVQLMSIYDILKTEPEEVSVDLVASDNLINVMINYGVSSPLLTARKIKIEGYIHDHSFYCKEFNWNILLPIIKVSEDECKQLELKTKKQSLCILWKNIRKSRITGSIIGDVLRTVRSGNYVEGPAKRNCLPGKSLKFICAINWGKENESVAKETYENVTGISIEEAGIFIHHETPYLASSPDGINRDLSLVVEFKCPYSIRDESPTMAKCLKETGGTYSLKKSHAYFAQVQLHMYTSGMEHADFVIWTRKGLYIESILFDPKFVVDLVSSAEKYYKTIFAPFYVKNVLYA